MRSDLPVTKLAENVYLLNEFDGTNCYLVVGSEKALLIDCGTGFCDIRGAAEKLTDLPIILAATHGHGDHTLAARDSLKKFTFTALTVRCSTKRRCPCCFAKYSSQQTRP